MSQTSFVLHPQASEKCSDERRINHSFSDGLTAYVTLCHTFCHEAWEADIALYEEVAGIEGIV